MHWRFDSYIVDSCDTINRCTGESLHPYWGLGFFTIRRVSIWKTSDYPVGTPMILDGLIQMWSFVWLWTVISIIEDRLQINVLLNKLKIEKIKIVKAASLWAASLLSCVGIWLLPAKELTLVTCSMSHWNEVLSELPNPVAIKFANF